MPMSPIQKLLTRIPLPWVWPSYTLLEGVRVPIRDSVFPPVLRRHLMNGGYEKAERTLIQHFIKEGDQVLELGASSGVISSFLWRQVGSEGRVVSVEADSRLKSSFERTLSFNGITGEWVHALCCPDWSKDYPASFGKKGFREDENPLGGSASLTSTGGSNITVLSAAEICEQTGILPNALVMDIEGAEQVWLEKEPEIPHSIRTIVVELHPTLVGSVVAGECLQVLVDQGFRIGGFESFVFALVR